MKECACNIVNVSGCFNNLFNPLQGFMWKFTMTGNLQIYNLQFPLLYREIVKT